MDVEAILRTLCRACSRETLTSALGLGGEVFVEIDPTELEAAAKALVEEHDLRHLSTITARNVGSGVEVLYHFWQGGGMTLRAYCEGDMALPSLVDVIPAADWYEREVHDLFGIEFVGHPDLSPLLLPDDWDGPPPMRNTENEA